MNKDDFIKMYKYTKKEKIIEELFYKCKANYKLNNTIDELEKYLIKVIETSSIHEQITCKYVLKYLRELKEGEE